MLVSLLTPTGIASAEPAPATSSAPARRLVLPRLRPGERCPVTTYSSEPSFELAPMLGSAPARPVGLGAGAVLQFADPGAEGGYPGDVWGGTKVLWAVAPDVATEVLVRGRQLDGKTRVRFGNGAQPSLRLLLPAPIQGEPRLAGGWRDFPGTTRVKVAGCYGYQIDTPSKTYTVVFTARLTETSN